MVNAKAMMKALRLTELAPAPTEELRIEASDMNLGRFNLWRPMVVNKIRGSGWTWALSSADFGNFNLRFPKSSIEPAAATGCRHCRPA